MTLEVFTTSIENGKQYDISTITGDLKWITSIDSQPGKLEFTVLEDEAVYLRNGDMIEAKSGGKTFFKGKVFIRQKKKTKLWRIVAYDNMRYLKNEDTIVFEASTAAQRFKKICEIQGLPYKILADSVYNCPAVVADKKSYFSMLEDALEETRTGTQDARYCIHDDAGTLTFVALEQMNLPYILGDESMITEYDFESSIEDAYNTVKVTREDKDKKNREVYVAEDQANVKKWGKLQLLETASDAELNAQQLQQKADDLLKINNKETQTLSLESVGLLTIKAGNSFNLRLKDLSGDGFERDRVALVHSCTHNLGEIHTMSMEVEVVH